MKNWHSLLLLAPPPTEGERAEIHSILQFGIPIKGGGEYTISLLGNLHTVNCICVTIPNCEGNLDKAATDRIGRINSHMLSTLRMAYSVETEVLRLGDGYLNMGYANEEPYPTKLVPQFDWQRNPDYRVDVEQIKNTFKGCFAVEQLIALLGEAGLPTLPLHFKLLTLYRVLEMASDGERGFSMPVRGAIDSREEDFRKLGLSEMRIRAFLHSYRARCAHVLRDRANGQVAALGLTSADVESIRRFLPLLREIALSVLQMKYQNIGLTFGQHQVAMPEILRTVTNPA